MLLLMRNVNIYAPLNNEHKADDSAIPRKLLASKVKFKKATKREQGI